MSAPIVRYYDIGNAGDGLMTNLTPPAGSQGGPIATLVTGTENFGNVLAGDWKVRTLAIGFDGNTADTVGFWLYDPVGDVGGGTNNVDFSQSGQEWLFRIRVSRDLITSFSSSQITSSPWVDIPRGQSATPYDLTAQVNALAAGSVNTSTSFLVPSTNFSGVNLINAFVYVAMKPALTAAAGVTSNWGFRLTATYP